MEANAMSFASITPNRLGDLLKRGARVNLIDVRTPAEFRAGHAEMARLVPLFSLDARAVHDARSGQRGEALYVMCRSGARARVACQKFRDCGHDNVILVEGGLEAWEQAGLPVARGKSAVSLERQVRIAAGTLVLVGSVLGFFVHPAFMGLAAFVGAGLVFAGITDTCGMGMLLARMPWNRLEGEAAAQGACAATGRTPAHAEPGGGS
jgi:rhodanese-related sulfurtransferase